MLQLALHQILPNHVQLKDVEGKFQKHHNKDLLNTANDLQHFSVAAFVDYIQTLANVRAVNGGTMSRLTYAERILEENEINLGAAASRIMDTDMAYESTKMARQNVLIQAAASMVTQANALNNVVLSLLQ